MQQQVATDTIESRPDPFSGTGRLLSLDAFRGLTIAGMLIVNNPGSWSAIYPPLRHAAWHGWTPTDLIFPFFLFIVGVAMTFSLGRQLEAGQPRTRLLLRAVRRAAVIILLGLALHGFPNYLDLDTLRLPGVLQRIGLAYLLAAPIVLWLGTRARLLVVAALLLGYWALETLVPVPGGFAGVLQPGQDLGAWIDRQVLGTGHLWIWSRTWDPEGLLSTLPAVATLLLGVFAGEWLRSGGTRLEKTIGLFAAGAVGIVVGLAWHPLFPINKNLWTSSYVVFTAGMACQTLAFCYWLIDVLGHRRWATPFVIFGTNAIAAFFLSSLFARVLTLVMVGQPPVALKTALHRTLFESWLSPLNASLAFALVYTLLWLAVMAVLYRRRIFIKV
jgi:predicted acyltransferase